MGRHDDIFEPKPEPIDDQEILDELGAGVSAEKIGERFGLSGAAIRSRARRARSRGMSAMMINEDPDWDQLIEMGYMRASDMASLLGVDAGDVSSAFLSGEPKVGGVKLKRTREQVRPDPDSSRVYLYSIDEDMTKLCYCLLEEIQLLKSQAPRNEGHREFQEAIVALSRLRGPHGPLLREIAKLHQTHFEEKP